MVRDKVIAYLASWGIKFNDNIILIPRKLQVGIKKWAYIDFLINHCDFYGWRWN